MYFEYAYVIAELKKQGWRLRFPKYYWETLTAVKGGRKIALHQSNEDNWTLLYLGDLTSSDEEALNNLVLSITKVGPNHWDNLIAEDVRAMCEFLSN